MNISQTGSTWLYEIAATNYTYGNMVYIWFSAQDLAGNPTEISFSFLCIDRYGPTVEVNSDHALSNLTQATQNRDVAMVVYCVDPDSGVQRIEIAVRGNAEVDWNSAQKYTAIAQGNNQYLFIIPGSAISATTMYYTIHAYDNDGNEKEIKSTFNAAAQTSGSGTSTSTTSNTQNTGGTSNTATNTNTATNSDANDDDTSNTPGNNQPLLFIGAGIGVAVLGTGIIKKARNRAVINAKFASFSDGKNMQSRSFGESSVRTSKTQDATEDWWESKKSQSTPASAASTTATTTTATEQTPSDTAVWEDVTPVTPTVVTTPSVSSGVFDPLKRMTPEMQTIYSEAQEFLDMGQDSIAVKSFEMLLRLAEKTNDAQLTEFIKLQMDQLYKD
jgi:hypothetical protein